MSNYFYAFVLDKQRPGVNWQGYFSTVWDAHLLASRKPGVPRDANKDAISMRIRQHVDPQILAASFTGQKPRYFGVRELTP